MGFPPARQGLFNIDTIPVSVKWLNRNFDCTLHGIKTRCGGHCCTSGPTGLYWPAKAYGSAPNTPCGNLGPQGCVLPLKDKPAACMLFPLTENKVTGQLVLYHRSSLKTGICKGNAGNGPHILDALRPGLVELFGEAEVDRVKVEVLAGRPVAFKITPRLRAQLDREAYEEKHNLPPTKRSKR